MRIQSDLSFGNDLEDSLDTVNILEPIVCAHTTLSVAKKVPTASPEVRPSTHPTVLITSLAIRSAWVGIDAA